MASPNFSLVTKCFLVVLLGIALVVLNSGYAVAEIPPCETLLTQGPCSNFPDCNQHCLSIGWKCGGLCKAPAPGTPLACLCKI
ncbi:putative defensin-like protein 30 [Fagus crenata]|uniref:Knottin scorpion toxin-like domain-containing protein n=1 Tax=Fagus sylvatica TaxID=28930 RepID=A0A2N9EH35_FAGSY